MRSRKIELHPEPALVYADASALVKLVVEEPESTALETYLTQRGARLVTSRIAVVEVTRAVGIASPSSEARIDAERLVESCLLVDVTDRLLRAAAGLVTREVRTLDAIHLASARRVDADEMLVYDRRLSRAAEAIGVATAAPGARYEGHRGLP